MSMNKEVWASSFDDLIEYVNKVLDIYDKDNSEIKFFTENEKTYIIIYPIDNLFSYKAYQVINGAYHVIKHGIRLSHDNGYIDAGTTFVKILTKTINLKRGTDYKEINIDSVVSVPINSDKFTPSSNIENVAQNGETLCKTFMLIILKK